MNKVRLGDIADYSDTRVDCSSLCVETYIGTDNIMQNKQGKENSQYTPSTGFTTEYKRNDILIANIRPYLKKIWFATNDGGSSADVLTIRVKDKEYLSKYIYYCLFQDVFFDYAMKGAKGSKMPRGDKKQILNFPIPDLSFPTQTAIADVLASLDDKIELNKKINRELENLARTIYEYWFVQNADEKWERKKIGDYIKSSGGFAFKSTEWKNNGYPVIKIKDIQEDNTLNLSGIDYVSKNTIIDDKFIAKAGEVIIAMTGATIGKVAIIPFHDNKIFVNQRVGIFKSNNPLEKLPFLINSLNQDYVRDIIISIASGAAQPNISNEQINSIPLVIPNEELVSKYNNLMKSAYIQILQNQQENNELAQLRDFLLPLLMNGQVTVGKSQEKPKTVLLKKQDDNNTGFEAWKTQVGLAARGNIDEQTLRNIYEAIDEKDR